MLSFFLTRSFNRTILHSPCIRSFNKFQFSHKMDDDSDEFEWTSADEAAILKVERTRENKINNIKVEKSLNLKGKERAVDQDAIEVKRAGTQRIEIEIELDDQTMWEKYRKNRFGIGSLSVSDLISTIWCEQQWSYRLDSKSYKLPEHRPKEIKTKSGKIVKVDFKKNVKREVVLKGGTKLHEKLELEVMGPQVVVSTVGEEEKWGLKIFNQIIGLDNLLQRGITREMPVLGFIDEILIIGVIDEISRNPLDPITVTTAPSKLPPETSSPKKSAQTTLDSFLSPSKIKLAPPTPPPPTGFILSDSKTRNSPTLPPKKDSKGPRFQVQLYHQLFSAMFDERISDSIFTKFEWTTLFNNLHLNSKLQFSIRFQETLKSLAGGILLYEDDTTSWNDLTGLISLLEQYAQLLRKADGTILENRLEIVYRLRGNDSSSKFGKGKGGTRGKSKKDSPPVESLNEFEIDLSPLSIEKNLDLDDYEVIDPLEELSINFHPLPALQILDNLPSFSLEELDAECIMPCNSQAQQSAPSPIRISRNKRSIPILSSPKKESIPKKRIRSSSSIPISIPNLPIGTESFSLNKSALKNHIERVLDLWNGKIELKGVELDEISRCRNCEFEIGCEWRELKAGEGKGKK